MLFYFVVITELSEHIAKVCVFISMIYAVSESNQYVWLLNVFQELPTITLPDPQKITEKIRVSKHNLNFTVLQKMQDNMKSECITTHQLCLWLFALMFVHEYVLCPLFSASQDNVDLGFGAMGQSRTFECAYCRKKYGEFQPV